MEKIKNDWYSFVEELCMIIEKSNIQPNKFTKAKKDVFNESYKLKPNTEINMKELFEFKEYSKENFMQELDRDIKNSIDQNDSVRLFLLISENLHIWDWDLKQNEIKTKYLFLRDEYDWATDTIGDLFDLFDLLNSNKNSNDILLYKMIFKEMFSLIDRLKTEASVEIARDVMGTQRWITYEQNKRQNEIWRNKFSQDMIFNGATFLKSNQIYFKKFKVDDEGWVVFEYDKMKDFLDPNLNMLYNIVREIRNGNEHSFPSNFSQSLKDSGILNQNNVSFEKETLTRIMYWKSWINLALSLLIYFLVNISREYHKYLYN